MRRTSSFLYSVFIALTLAATTPLALRAQSIPNDHFSVNHYTPAIGPGNYLQVDGAAVGGHLTPSFEIQVDYAHRPFVLYGASCSNGNTTNCSLEKGQVDIIGQQLTTNLAGTLALWNRLQLGLIVPLVYTHGDKFAASTPGFSTPYIDIPGGYAFGFGDPRLSAKVRLLGSGNQGFMLAAAAFVTFPVAHALESERSLGYDTVTGGGHVAAEFRVSRFRAGVNVGGEYRPEREILATTVGSDFYYGAALGFDITSLLSVLTEIAGSTRFKNELDQNPIEWRLAGRLTQGDFVFQLGAGAGLVSGVGIPNFRVMGGAAFQPAGLDADGDGVGDQQDACPSEPEDRDGYQDEDGCPDVDNDGDGLNDDVDKCPNDPEDHDGYQDEDGCPDRDNDNDGIPDGYDSCPDQAEDKDGDRDEDGCPDNDRDRDGVEDDKDKCPDEPEDTDGFGDEDGCPETDFDGDGIPDDQDQCPDQPENKNGVDDDDGCPEP
jgi:hypothetical protein